MNDLVRSLLERGIAAGAFPSAQACAFHRGALLFEVAAGLRGASAQPVDTETRYDVASLTKVMATATAAWVLLSGGVLHLDDPVSRFFPAFDVGEKRAVTVRHLLAHTSGLPAWRPLFAPLLADPQLASLYPGFGGPEPAWVPVELRRTTEAALRAKARSMVIEAAARAPLETEPGRACVYSDLGFILLGEIVAACAGMGLDRFCEQWIFRPLGLGRTGFAPAPDEGPFAPTGTTRPREPARGQEGLYPIPPQRPRESPGEVDDDNCWAMGGISGHAGLFSTARDVARWGEAIRTRAPIGEPAVLDRLLALDPHPEGPPRALGFDVPSGPRSSAGSRIGRKGPKGARGHLAFTGCSIWIDFDRDLTVALLTNRVYTGRSSDAGIREFRPLFHDAVLEALEGP